MKKNNDNNIFDKIKKGISDFFYDASVDLHEMFHPKKKEQNTVVTQAKLKEQKSRGKIIELICIWSVLIIPLVNFLIFGVIGSISSWPVAFEHYTPDGKTYDFYNFEYLFKTISEPNSIFKESFFNTLKYWCFNFIIITPLCYLMGFFLYKNIWGYKAFRYIFFFPSIISSVIIAAFFKYMVGPHGQVQWLIEKIFGIKDVLLLENGSTAFGTMLFYNFYTGLTGGLLMWLASFSRIPVEVVEAGKIDGLTTMKEFVHITVPITWPFMATMLMLQCTGILGAGGPALLLTGGAYGTYDLGYYEYTLTVSGTISDQGIAGAIGLVKGFLILPFTLFINHLVNKIETVEV